MDLKRWATKAEQLALGTMLPRLRQFPDVTVPIVLLATALVFYLTTLAPTVLWGDDAAFQRTAFEGVLRKDAGGHWLWLQAARIFQHLPVGDVAYRANLLSAVAAAAAIALLYLAVRAAGIGPGGAFAASISLAVAHTFWMHAVRAEVYTVFLCVFILQIGLWLRWKPEQPYPIMLASVLFGATLLGHQMALLLLPAVSFLLWRRRAWLTPRQWLACGLLFLVGAIPFVAVVWWQGDGNLANGMWVHFTRFGDDYSHSMFAFSLSKLPYDTAMWLIYLGLQFPGAAGLLGLWGVLAGIQVCRRREPLTPIDGRARVDEARGQTRDPNGLATPILTLLILYLTGVFFAFSYRVNDRYVFYLPSFVAFTFFIGLGWQTLAERRLMAGTAIKIALLAVLVVVPLASYSLTPRLLTAMNMNPLGIRTLPGREPNWFFLWPGKRGYLGASEYARGALRTVPPNSIIIAETTPIEPLHYLQTVEGLRPDVRLVHIKAGGDLAPVVKNLPAGQPIFLADDNPQYYNMGSLPGARLQADGVVYQLILANQK